MKPIILIENSSEFDHLIEQLTRSQHVAVDTESNSFHAYFERICLIQVSTAEEDYIVDPLALENLSPLGEIFAAPGIEKVFHAASNDILGLKRDYQFHFSNVFDTAIACKLLGCKQLGLAKILEKHFGVLLSKKWQRCDWAKRPLRVEQLNYARLDTHYLIPLRHLMAADLAEKNQWERAVEAFEKACQQEVQEKIFLPENFIQINGARSLDTTGRNILRALYVFREHEARRRDRAPFRVLSNEILFQLARHRPRSTRDFAGIKGLPRSFRKGRAANGLLELIRRAERNHEEVQAMQ